MQVKTIMRYHFTPVRMAIIKKKKKAINNKFWRGYGEKGNFLHYWECTLGGNVNWRSHYGRQYGGFFKTKTRAATHS